MNPAIIRITDPEPVVRWLADTVGPVISADAWWGVTGNGWSLQERWDEDAWFDYEVTIDDPDLMTLFLLRWA